MTSPDGYDPCPGAYVARPGASPAAIDAQARPESTTKAKGPEPCGRGLCFHGCL